MSIEDPTDFSPKSRGTTDIRKDVGSFNVRENPGRESGEYHFLLSLHRRVQMCIEQHRLDQGCH